MPKYHVRLESQTDSQARFVTLNAESPEEARARCEEKEADLCAFRIEDADRLARLDAALTTNDAGKVVALEPVSKNDKAEWHAHHQSKPYRVAAVEEA